MTTTGDRRQIRDPAELEDFYADNVAAHVYALVDLEAPFWPAGRWHRRDDAVVGVVLLPGQRAPAVYAVSTKDPAGCLELLRELVPELPKGTLITGPTGLAATLEPIRPLGWDGPHLRYVLRAGASPPPPPPEVTSLEPDHRDELLDLYAVDPGAAFFLPHMLDDDSFVGVYDGADLVAAAGTHVLSEAKRIAAIGAVFTHPDHRGRGLGRAVTLGVIGRITDRIDTISLNVAAENEPAIAVYERIGFEAILAYEEAELA